MEKSASTSSSLDATSATDDSQTSASEKGKRSRKTLQQMAEIRKAELERLKLIDTTRWAQKRRETHESKIEDLAGKVEADKDQMEKQSMKRTKTTTATVRAPPMKEEQTRRLIYARKVADTEFEKALNAAGAKWDKVADIFNVGFVAKKSVLSGVEDDVIFPPLPDGENDFTGTRLQSKWEKVSKDYRELMLMKQNI